MIFLKRNRNIAEPATGSRHNRFFQRLKTVTAWAMTTATIGCATVGPDYQQPKIELPARWNVEIGPTDAASESERLPEWWRTLNDPLLTDLIEQATHRNLDFKEAVSRLQQARALLGKSRSAIFPNAEAAGSVNKSRGSKNTGSDRERELYSIGLDAGWEIDFFGGVRRSVEAAEADLKAKNEDLNDVRVTLAAEVALSYIELRSYQARLAVSEKNIAAMQESLELVVALSEAGGADQLAVEQARYNLESSRSKLYEFKIAHEAAMNRLAVLLGRPAGALHAELAEFKPLPEVSAQMAIGVPADLLRRRPDIRRAEQELAAETARIGVAVADLYPRFTLNGSIGLESLSLNTLFQSASRTWSVGPSFSWPVFNAGSIRSLIAAQKEVQQQTLIAYERTILNALEEVGNALYAFAAETRKIETLQKAVTSAQTALQLTQAQYTAGMKGFDAVLDARQMLLTIEEQLAESKGDVLTRLVQLYKALGGGWNAGDLLKNADQPEDDFEHHRG